MDSFVANVVIGAPRGTWNEQEQRVDGPERDLGEFYAALLGMRIIRDDWIKVGHDATTYPQLAFGDGWSEVRPPRWPAPEHPQQMHLDITVPDVEEAGALAVRNGATLLRDGDGFVTHADPVGHPFCLYPGAERRIERVVIDCFSPRSLASFYGELLGMRRVLDTPALVVVEGAPSGVAEWAGSRHWTAPRLAFQHAPEYVAPRWGDPAYPLQVHLDLLFRDGDAAMRRAESLGAIRLPGGGSCPVYADPAGHPFCLCSPGQ